MSKQNRVNIVHGKKRNKKNVLKCQCFLKTSRRYVSVKIPSVKILDTASTKFTRCVSVIICVKYICKGVRLHFQKQNVTDSLVHFLLTLFRSTAFFLSFEISSSHAIEGAQ